MNDIGANRSRRWTVVIVFSLIAVLVIVVVRDLILNDIDEGFIKFQPDASLFPAAPVEDAKISIGIGVPASSEVGSPDECPYDMRPYTNLEPTYPYQEAGDRRRKAARGREWHTVRYDWETDGDAQAWVISERTVAFVDLAKGEKHLNDLRDGLTYCGWGYKYSGAGAGSYNRMITDLDGLPEGALAYVIDMSPRIAGFPSKSNPIDPDKFEGLGVVMPGHKPGHMVFMTWIGWSADVPTDEFVATANRIYDAANAAPDPDEAFKKDDKAVDTESFEVFRPSESRVGSLLGGGTSPHPQYDEYDEPLDAEACGLDWNETLDGYLFPEAYESKKDPPIFKVENNARVVWFTSAGFTERWRYLSAKDRLSQVVTPLCVGTFPQSAVLIEPIAVPPGLPEGARAALWHGKPGIKPRNWATVLTDDERQLVMVVSWDEHAPTLPEPLFVEAINAAWTEFLTANS